MKSITLRAPNGPIAKVSPAFGSRCPLRRGIDSCTTTVNGASRVSLKATFNLQEPSNHTNYYGLVFGGSNLDAPTQAYAYFVIAQNGMFLVRHNQGGTATDVVRRATNAAVRQPGGRFEEQQVIASSNSDCRIARVLLVVASRRSVTGSTKFE